MNKANGSDGDSARSRLTKLIKIISAVLIFGIVLAASILLILYCIRNPVQAIVIRDVLIVLLAIGLLALAIALIVLLVQLAILINLVNNQIIPVIDNAKETVDTLKGTTKFVSQELVGPIIQLNSYLAGLKKLVSIFKIVKK